MEDRPDEMAGALGRLIHVRAFEQRIVVRSAAPHRACFVEMRAGNNATTRIVAAKLLDD